MHAEILAINAKKYAFDHILYSFLKVLLVPVTGKNQPLRLNKADFVDGGILGRKKHGHILTTFAPYNWFVLFNQRVVPLNIISIYQFQDSSYIISQVIAFTTLLYTLVQRKQSKNGHDPIPLYSKTNVIYDPDFTHGQLNPYVTLKKCAELKIVWCEADWSTSTVMLFKELLQFQYL